MAPYPAHAGSAKDGLPLQIEESSVIPGPGPDAMESIPNPPIPGEPASSLNELFAAVNAFAKSHGFGIVKHNGVFRPGKRSRYVFQCDRYGIQRPGRGAGLRRRKSRKSGCQWKIAAESLPENGFQWTLRSFPNAAHHQHNHGPSLDAAAHPVHRRLISPVKSVMRTSSRRVGIRARDIGGIVRDQFPNSVYTPRDIYNARARISRENLDGYRPTAALIKLFDEKGVPYIAERAKDEPNRLVGLVWTFPYCAQMWRRFPEIMSFDNTYNTNRFKLPLFQVTGQTCLGTVFNAAFGLIDNERLEGFQFLADGVRKLLDQYSIRVPDVVITDFDNQMKKALGLAFPDAQQQLCIHHINSNVLLQSKRRWVYSSRNSSTGEESSSDEPGATLNNSDRQAVRASARQEEPVSTNDGQSQPIAHDYHGVLSLWKQVVFAESEEGHEKAWECLCKQFGDQRAILTYLYSTYMPGREQWARCFIRRYRNFGIRVTSGTEASNNNVKSYLLNGMSHLYRLVDAIQGMLEDQERDFRQACAQDEVLTAREHMGRGAEYLGELPQVVSQKALVLISKEHRKALKAIPSSAIPWPADLGPCADDCTTSTELGIPCSHTIYGKLISGTYFTKWDVHPRWHLRETANGDAYRRILDPKIARSFRGRPKNTSQPLPASMAVAVELADTRPESCRVSGYEGRCGPPVGGSEPVTPVTTALPLADSSRQARALHLGSGRTTGMRASGQRIRPSIRRQKSQWELSVDEMPVDEGRIPLAPTRASMVGTRKRGPRRCSRCHGIGHKNSKACPQRDPDLTTSGTQESRQRHAVSSAKAQMVSNNRSANVMAAVTASPPTPLSRSHEGSYAPPTLASTGPRPNHGSDQSPQVIFERYIAKREAWYKTQPRGSIKTNQEYRRAMSLPLRYDRECYEWCLDEGRMRALCTTSTGIAREWTREEMMAYLDLKKAETSIGYEKAGDMDDRNERSGLPRGGVVTDDEGQPAERSSGKQEQCIVVKL